MSMVDEPMFKHRGLYDSALVSQKLNISSDSFAPQPRADRAVRRVSLSSLGRAGVAGRPDSTGDVRRRHTISSRRPYLV